LAEEAAKKQDAKSRELDKVAAKLRRLSAAMVPMQSEITAFQVKIEEWLVKNASLGMQSVEAIKHKAQEILASRRGNIESLKKLIETDQKIYRQKEASLQLPEGGIETVNARFREQEEKLESIDREITVHMKNYKSLSDTHKLLSERYGTLRHFLCSTVEVSFEEYLQHKKYKGKMTFDHDKCTLMTTVDVNSRDSAKEAHSAGSHKNLSGGENSYSNVCLLLALSSVSPCPWQVLDEFDVFM
jgi:chromosome segregation ATPase